MKAVLQLSEFATWLAQEELIIMPPAGWEGREPEP